MQQINVHKIDWQKVILYVVLFVFIFAYGKSCQSQGNAVAAQETATKKADSLSVIASKKVAEAELLNAKLADLKLQYDTVDKLVYEITNERNEAIKKAKVNVQKAKKFTNEQMQNYFDANYGNSTNSVVHLDSIPSSKIITDLEIGKGAVIEAELLYKENTQINLQVDNLQSQNSILENQKELNLEAYVNEQKANEINKKQSEINFKLYKKEKSKKTLWKLATIPAFVLGILIVK